MSIFNVFTLMGGIAMFLYGMDMMGKSLEQTAGSKLQGILSRMTSSPLRGLLLGLAVTAVIQSSGATTVMAVGFVNSGLMQLRQAIGVIMGANIGTTVTGWLLALSGLEGDSFLTQMLNPDAWSPILGFIGVFMFMICKDPKKGVGKIMLGFSILMFGMKTMTVAMSPLAGEPWFMKLFVSFSNPLLGMLAGAVLTALLQSSSAALGILQALSATGAVTYASAMPIIMGQNIGTTITALLSSTGANKNAKRTAFVHLYFNLIGSLVFLGGFYGLNALIHFSFFADPTDTFGIAVVHTLFNIITTALLLPANRWLEKLAYLTVPEDPSVGKEEVALLDERLMSTPSVAANRAYLTGMDMAEISRVSMLQAIELTSNWSDDQAKQICREEDAVDHYEDVLGSFLVKLSAMHLSPDDHRKVNTLLYTISDFERISDYATNLVRTAQEIHDKNITFSAAAQSDLGVLETAVRDILEKTVDSFQKNDLYKACKIEPLEEVVDELVREVKARHIARLREGTCTIEYGFILDELLTSYERVADHCSNIAVAMVEIADDKFDTHAYLGELKYSSNEANAKFEKRYEKYLGRYALDTDLGEEEEQA